MDAAFLRQIPRSDLQKLAQSHGVKANLKSVTIIERLCELNPNGVPHLPNSLPPRGRSQTSAAPHTPPIQPAASSQLSAPKASPHGEAAPLSAPTSAQSAPVSAPVSGLASPPATPSPAPVSPLARPEDIQKLLVEMQSFSNSNRAMVAFVPQIRERTRAIREACEAMRKKIRAERYFRKRIQAYVEHTMKVTPQWTPGHIYNTDDSSFQADEDERSASGSPTPSGRRHPALFPTSGAKRQRSAPADDDDDEPPAKRPATFPTAAGPEDQSAQHASVQSSSSHSELEKSIVIEMLGDGTLVEEEGDEGESAGGSPILPPRNIAGPSTRPLTRQQAFAFLP